MFGQALRNLFGPAPGLAPGQPVTSTPAFRVMRVFNPNGLIGVDDGNICMVEDCTDPDGRMYRIEYQSTPDARHAIAWCRYSPWGSVSQPHTINGGMICIGAGAHDSRPGHSRYDLETVIRRARFWCTAVSVYHETGEFPNA